MTDLAYFKIDGLFYPNIESGWETLESNLTKFSILCLQYLHEHRREMYRELLMIVKLAEYCRTIDNTVFERFERIQDAWLKDRPTAGICQ